MGVRLYDPGTGRFWSVDPTPGGNATAYDYCTADPVNCTDLDGNFGFGWAKKALKKIAVVAEVASNIPGPIGAAAAGISAGAYAVTGNKAKALAMGITVAAAMVPGGGAMVKVGMAAAKSSGRLSAKAGASAVKANKATGSSGALRRVGSQLESVHDVLANPGLLAGKSPAQVKAVIGKTPGWQSETLGKGRHKGQGWVLREYSPRGNPTGAQIRWHPGGGHHGPKPYWRVVGKSGPVGGRVS